MYMLNGNLWCMAHYGHFLFSKIQWKKSFRKILFPILGSHFVTKKSVL